MPEYTKHIPAIASADAARVLKKDEEYGASWLKRGGVGAYFVMARKIDRLETQAARHGYDIFSALADLATGESLVDTIRDLRGYLLLIEAEAMVEGLLEAPGTTEAMVEGLLEAPGTTEAPSFTRELATPRVHMDLEENSLDLYLKTFLADLRAGREVVINGLPVVSVSPVERAGMVQITGLQYKNHQKVIDFAHALLVGGPDTDTGRQARRTAEAIAEGETVPPRVDVGPGYLRDEVRAFAILMEQDLRRHEAEQGSWKTGAEPIKLLSSVMGKAQDAFSLQQVIESAKRLHTPSEAVPEETLERHRQSIGPKLVAAANYAMMTLDVTGLLPKKTPLEIAAEFALIRGDEAL
jgi:hypothetical protein